jgi:hypothetical protein
MYNKKPKCGNSLCLRTIFSVLSLVVTAILAGGAASRKCEQRKVKGKRLKTENSGFFNK